MAEIAAGAGVALAAEEVISTSVQLGAAGYMIGKPTMPLKATFSMIANAKDDSSQRSLARSNHTLTVLANKAYIFGGETAHDGIASNDMHVVTLTSSGKPESDYHLIPAIPSTEGEKVPVSRTKHAASSFNGSVAIYGGSDGNGELVNDGSSIWIFTPEKTAWSRLEAANAPGPRRDCKLFAEGNKLILYGGEGNFGTTSSDVWKFDTEAETWTQLPIAPCPTSNAALTNNHLYLISGSDPMSSKLHILEISRADEETKWLTITYPTNPMAPGPRPRQGGGLLPVTTGYGRNYLIYFLGEIEKPEKSITSADEESREKTQWSDMWTLQLPSSDLDAKPKWSLGEAIKPAKIKDAIRSAVGAESGMHLWAEVDVQPPSDMQIPEGKLHPGPRGFFGCDVMEDKKSVVFWGGQNAKGERVGDGWIVSLE